MALLFLFTSDSIIHTVMELPLGTITGAVAGAVLFLVFGLMPAFRFGGFLVLVILNKATGNPVPPTRTFRVLIALGSVFCIAGGIIISVVMGGFIGLLIVR